MKQKLINRVIEIRSLLKYFMSLFMLTSILKSGRDNMKSLFENGTRRAMSVKNFEILGTALTFEDSRNCDE